MQNNPGVLAGVVITEEVAMNLTAHENHWHPSVVEWHRRARAAERLEPLDNGVVDPWRERPRPPLTLAQIDGVLAAAAHLENAGLPPLFDEGTLRSAWQKSPEHRQRLERLARGSAAA
jgi:hypothetical protein